jgi:hypothetical protein
MSPGFETVIKVLLALEIQLIAKPPPARLNRAEGESKMKPPRPNGRPWTPEEDAQLLALLNSKIDRPSIGLELKRTVVSHNRAVEGSEGRRREGAEIAMLSRNKPWNWTIEEDERLRALVARGASVVKAAAALKRKIVSVRMRARALGCPFPPLRVVRQKWADPSDNV